MIHQIAHLGPGQIGAEPGPEIIDLLGRPQNSADAGPIGSNQAPI
jgi:hypothetical protein